jgi:hypothetical protein
MELSHWFASITPTVILAVVLWLSRHLIITRLTNSVKHEFDGKLEALRTDLRLRESEIDALRASAITTMANRRAALDKRRLEAVDQLWAALIALAPAKTVSTFVARLNFEKCVARSVHNERIRKVAQMIAPDFEMSSVDTSMATRARPFVSPMAWALFSAYQAIVMQAVAKREIIKLGIGSRDIIDWNVTARLVHEALPDYDAYITKTGDAGYHGLLGELETRLLTEFQKMLGGLEDDETHVKRAAKIVELANEVSASSAKVAKKSQATPAAVPSTGGSAAI